MTTVRFTKHLRRFFPDLQPLQIEAPDVASLMRLLDEQHPGIAGYIIEDSGGLRKHVNIFVDGATITDRESLSDSLDGADEVYIMQALSGG